MHDLADQIAQLLANVDKKFAEVKNTLFHAGYRYIRVSTWNALDSLASLEFVEAKGVPRVVKRFNIIAYDRSRGVAIDCSINAFGTGQVESFYTVLVRKGGGAYRSVTTGDIDLNVVLIAANSVSGAPLVRNEACRFRCIVPTVSGNVFRGPVLVRPCTIVEADVLGCGKISDTGTVDFDVADPGAVPWFVIRCVDLRKRNFYLILNGAKWFYVAQYRGTTLKLLATDVLWDNTDWPFDVKSITVEDFEFVMAAVQAFCSERA